MVVIFERPNVVFDPAQKHEIIKVLLVLLILLLPNVEVIVDALLFDFEYVFQLEERPLDFIEYLEADVLEREVKVGCRFTLIVVWMLKDLVEELTNISPCLMQFEAQQLLVVFGHNLLGPLFFQLFKRDVHSLKFDVLLQAVYEVVIHLVHLLLGLKMLPVDVELTPLLRQLL